jgi:hypothetical protein
MLSNASSESSGARKEIIKYHIFDLVAEVLSVTQFKDPQVHFEYDLIEISGWFLNNLSLAFDDHYASEIENSNILPVVIQVLLYHGDVDIVKDALAFIDHITNVHSDIPGDIIVKYDEGCESSNTFSQFSFISRLY